jgi:hypothetical protein
MLICIIANAPSLLRKHSNCLGHKCMLIIPQITRNNPGLCHVPAATAPHPSQCQSILHPQTQGTRQHQTLAERARGTRRQASRLRPCHGRHIYQVHCLLFSMIGLMIGIIETVDINCRCPLQWAYYIS